MAKNILLRRNVFETLESGLANAAEGTNTAAPAAETIGARTAFQSQVSGSPTSYSIPILASLDGVNFGAGAICTLTNTSDVQVIPTSGIAAFKVGTVSITGGTSPAATILARTQ